MANLKEIKRKIKSTKGTQKTTNAMKLVSSSKLKKAEKYARQSKYYELKLTNFIQEISYNLKKVNSEIDNQFLKERAVIKNVNIIFITSDKGLCGGFNSQTINKVRNIIKSYEDENINVKLTAIGKKGISYFNFNKIELLDEIIELSSAPDYDKAKDIINEKIEDYLNGNIDKITLIYNGFKNLISQELKVKNLLPIDTSKFENSNNIVEKDSNVELEPDDENLILNALVKKYIEYSLYYALIDSLAAEHSSRMQAMDTATRNAKDMVKKLSVKYNKARQEAITTELIEIISGLQ